MKRSPSGAVSAPVTAMPATPASTATGASATGGAAREDPSVSMASALSPSGAAVRVRAAEGHAL